MDKSRELFSLYKWQNAPSLCTLKTLAEQWTREIFYISASEQMT